MGESSPQMIYVESTNVQQVGYDDSTMMLHILFKDGRLKVYSDVPASVYREFLDADSKGSFFNRRVKPIYHAVT